MFSVPPTQVGQNLGCRAAAGEIALSQWGMSPTVASVCQHSARRVAIAGVPEVTVESLLEADSELSRAGIALTRRGSRL
jgi:hypothetical protein